MKVITMAQQKGGVGKTTLAIHLATEAVRQGHEVVILELDRQGTASQWYEKREGSPKVLKIDSSDLDQNLRLLDGFGVDFVILDLPGTHTTAINRAIKASDLVLIPGRPHDVDVTASVETLATIQRLERPYAYVFTFVEGKGGPKRVADFSEDFGAEGHPVCPSYVSRAQVYADAIGEGKTVVESSRKSKAAEEIGAIWKWTKNQIEVNDEQGSKRISETSKDPAETTTIH